MATSTRTKRRTPKKRISLIFKLIGSSRLAMPKPERESKFEQETSLAVVVLSLPHSSDKNFLLKTPAAEKLKVARLGWRKKMGAISKSVCAL